jgi:iron complex outermembrane receptor protein
LIFPESFDPADPASYADFTRRGRDGALLTQAGPTVQYRPAETGTKEKQLKLDVDYDLDFGPLTTFQFGGQYRTQNYINYTGGGARVLTPAVAAGPGRPARNPVYQTSANVSYNTVIGSPPPAGPAANTYYFTQAQYQQFIAQNSGVTNGAPLFTGLQGAPDGAPSRLAIPLFDYGNLSRYYDLSNFNQRLLKFADGLPQIPNYVIDEDIVAGYAMLDFAQDFLGMRLTGNAGLRYTFTRDRSTGTNRRNEIRLREGTGVNGVAPIYDTIIAGIQEVTIQNEYHDFLPAVNLNLEALPNLFVRATYAKNLARPIPTDLTPAINCNIDLADFVVGEDVCSAGNPALQPYRADQYDLNASWYPNADTMVSVGYYYKNITSFVLPAQTRNGVDLFGDGVLYTVRQKVNGFGAKLDGFEFTGQTFFSFLPAPLDGFGVKGNFTYARALNSALTNLSTGEPLDGYPGLSKYTYNASLLYDKGFLQASLNYNRRSDWLQAAADGNNGNNPIFRRGETFIDAKVQFRISPHYSITIEGQNLGKEFSKTYIDDARPIEYYYPGQRLWLGMQFKL